MNATKISSRRQCLRVANLDALEWAQQSDGEEFADLTRENDERDRQAFRAERAARRGES